MGRPNVSRVQRGSLGDEGRRRRRRGRRRQGGREPRRRGARRQTRARARRPTRPEARQQQHYGRDATEHVADPYAHVPGAARAARHVVGAGHGGPNLRRTRVSHRRNQRPRGGAEELRRQRHAIAGPDVNGQSAGGV